MKRTFIGLDISKEWLDYAVCTEITSGTSVSSRIPNDIKGIMGLLKKLQQDHTKEELWFCFEHTGNYGLLLSSLLQSEGFSYSAVPALEIKKSLGIKRGKSDAVDAQRICEYAVIHSHKLKPTQLPSQELLQIKNLLAYRAQLIKVRSQLINSSKSYKIADQIVDLSFINADLEDKIASLATDIKALEKKIEQLIHSNKELSKIYGLISSVKGIGLVVAAFMIIYTNNFTSFDSPRKFNCFVGLAPFENSSGLSTKPAKTSHYRHKYLKSLFFNGANSAAQFDPQLKKFYERKRAEGKQHLQVMNAISCKLISRAFATVRRESPYVVLM